jgi:hypothetical protein
MIALKTTQVFDLQHESRANFKDRFWLELCAELAMATLITAAIVALLWVTLVSSGEIWLRAEFAVGFILGIWMFSALGVLWYRMWFRFPRTLVISESGLELEYDRGQSHKLTWEWLSGRTYLQNYSADPSFAPYAHFCLTIVPTSTAAGFLFRWSAKVYLTTEAYQALRVTLPNRGLSLRPLESSISSRGPTHEIYRVLQ